MNYFLWHRFWSPISSDIHSDELYIRVCAEMAPSSVQALDLSAAVRAVHLR